jgi:hypothetical protein
MKYVLDVSVDELMEDDCRSSLWPLFATPIFERLGADDDGALWRLAVETILASIEAEAKGYSGKSNPGLPSTGTKNPIASPAAMRQFPTGAAWPIPWATAGSSPVTECYPSKFQRAFTISTRDWKV